MKIKAFLNDNLPISKGSVQIPIRGLIDEYHRRYNLAKNRSKFTFKHTVYNIKDSNATIIHVLVPSETVPGFTYDVLFQISYEPTTTKLEDCEVKIFSNAPSFVYTYAYVFYHLSMGDGQKPGMIVDSMGKKIPKDRLLISDTEKKLPNEVRKQRPVIRNTLGLPLWDKSLYYALFYLTEEVSFLSIRTKQVPIKESELMNQVRDFDKLMADRKREEKKYRESTKAVRTKVNKSLRKSEIKLRKANNPTKMIKPVAAKKPIAAANTKRAKSTRK